MMTVAFATFNGADTLPFMLEAMSHLDQPEGGWHLIAVNNGSTDATCIILDRYRGRLPLRVVQQPAKGKSNALNTAIGEVTGDLLVLTDDDVLPEQDWLVAWRRCADRYSDLDVIGGKIEIHWTGVPPAWISSAIPLGVAYAQTHRDLHSGPIDDPRFITGPNMAVRMHVVQHGLRFDSALGPTGHRYGMGEDTAFVSAAQAMGFKLGHCQDALVKHIVLPEQYQKSWLLKRAYRYGEFRGAEDARTQRHDGSRKLAGIPRWIFGEQVRQLMNVFAGSLKGDHIRRMSSEWETRYLAGYVSSYRKACRGNKHKKMTDD